jgi:hypothetical protein
MAVPRGLADAGGVGGAENKDAPQRLLLQMRLIPKHNRPVCDCGIPSGPLCRALNGTEHATLGSRIDDSILGREAKAVHFQPDGPVAGGANDANLFCPESLPLLDEMAEHRSLAPGQEQFRLSHARGAACGQEDHAEGASAVSTWGHRDANVGQTFLSAGGGDFPVATSLRPADWKVRLTGRQECLPYYA